MSATDVARLAPITRADVPDAAAFLHENMDSRISAEGWIAAMTPPWSAGFPNHGFWLRAGEEVVGVYLAFYSERDIDGETVKICNLAAWCVLDGYRSSSVRLLRAMLAQRGYEFTDLSPSGNVVPLNLRLRFHQLDTSTSVVPNIPWPIWSRMTKVVWKPSAIREVLQGDDLATYLDHAECAAARHLVVVRGLETCYVMFRRDRRKRLPLFGSILYIGNRKLFDEVWRHVFRHMLLRHHVPFTLAERRIVGQEPGPGVVLKSPRPKMYRSSRLGDQQIDYLYSELTCVAW
jgi:hypothetical protein